ncbi:MAG: HAMP domain-containing histidine kinase [Anaerolineales bacterium]|nr:HAMP domain-containing histidine kinase [Anaerolineales bacterium]
MDDSFSSWLYQNSMRLCEMTLADLPNVLPESKEVDEFICMIANILPQSLPDQLYAMQLWAVRQLSSDSAAANDWLLIERILKDNVMQELAKAFGADEVVKNWGMVDRAFTYAIIETTKLANRTDNAVLLDHMVNLRRQMAELNRTKSNFIQVAAHELKTPLTLLEGYTDMLREETSEENPLMQMYVAGLDGGTARLREIIGDMIDLSLIESGFIKINYQMVYLEQMVRQVARTTHRAFEYRHVDLEIEEFGMSEPIFGDPERLSQVFSKVISNGLKYTPDGGKVTIRARMVRSEEAADDLLGYVDVQVSDTGIGIAPENLERIFESFGGTGDVALHSSGKTKFKGGGPGLGLPIARGIVEAHGGRIWAQSAGFDERKKPGSTFHIELPRLKKAPIVAEEIS